MASYEIVNNTSRYPYDYSVITDGDTLTYTDTTESQYILPPINLADADKYLQVNNTGTGTQWNTIANELPSNVGITGPSFLQTQNEVLSYTAISQVPSQTGATAGSLLVTNGTTASWTMTPSITSLRLSGGSAAVPSLTFDDTSVPQNCGFYGGGNDIVHFAAAGSLQLTFRETGLFIPNGKTIRGAASTSTFFDFVSGQNPRISNTQTVSTVNYVSSAVFGSTNTTLLNTQSSTGATGSGQIVINSAGTIVLSTSATSTTPSQRISVGDGGLSVTGFVTSDGTIAANTFRSTGSGTAANPSYRFNNTAYSAHQGIYSGATGNISFSTTQSADTSSTAVERVKINDSGLTVNQDLILQNKIRPNIGYVESTAATVTVNLSDVIQTQNYIVNTSGTSNQTVDINNDLSITYSVAFTMYFYGLSTQTNTIALAGNFGTTNHSYVSNFSVGASNTTSFTTTEPNSSQIEFVYRYNSGTPANSVWIVRRIAPTN